MRALAVYRYAGELQRANGEIGSELNQRGNQEFADRHREIQECQRKEQAAHDMQAHHTPDRADQERDEGILRSHPHTAGIGQQPGRAGQRHERHATPIRARLKRGKVLPPAPDQPQTDGKYQKSMGEGFRAFPDFDHRMERRPIQRKQHQQQWPHQQRGALPGKGTV